MNRINKLKYLALTALTMVPCLNAKKNITYVGFQNKDEFIYKTNRLISIKIDKFENSIVVGKYSFANFTIDFFKKMNVSREYKSFLVLYNGENNHIINFLYDTTTLTILMRHDKKSKCLYLDIINKSNHNNELIVRYCGMFFDIHDYDATISPCY